VFPVATFKTAIDFWSNLDGTGIAQDTNRKFISKGTNFTISGNQVNVGTYPDPKPTGSLDVEATTLFNPVPPQIASVCAGNIDCTMTFYSTQTTQRASTLSIFDQDLRARNKNASYLAFLGFPAYQTDRIFSVNRFNMDDIHPYLMASAVSYSAGLINHFFRGRLDVLGPETGPFAVVDQSKGQGFTKVKLRVRNATPNEALSGGTVQAIANFHHNGCYSADLLGEFRVDETGNLITPCNNYRSEDPDIRVTEEQPASFGVGAIQDFTFDFGNPIPLDATDLFIQVYYRGKVGDQENDFAIGAADVSEPTWIAVVNATDVFELNADKFYPYQEIIDNIAQPPYSVIDIDGDHKFNPARDVDPRGGDVNFEIKVNGDVVGNATVGEGRFARLAALVSPFGFELTLTKSGNGFGGVTSYNLPAKSAQIDYDRNLFLVSPLSRLRKQTYQWDSVTHYHFWPTTSNSLQKMEASAVTDATKPVQVNMTP